MRMVVMVAAHKPYWMPEDAAYWPVLVGAAGKEAPPGWRRDDAGENISARNATFCELTGHYWLWKNVEADVYGLCHYRRYFARVLPVGDKRRRIMPAERLGKRMSGCAVLLPRKRHYWIETNYSQYAHAHHAEDLRAAQRVIEQRHPAYLPAWERVMRRRSGHRFNMFLMRREAFLAYSAGCSTSCSSWSGGWTFPDIPPTTAGCSALSGSACWTSGWSTSGRRAGSAGS